MSIVYFPHHPVRWDPRSRGMVALDLEPAQRFGRVVVILPGHDRPPCADDALPTLRAALARFEPADYLGIAGDLDMVMWAGILASRRVGDGLRLLKYNNRTREYEVKTAPKGLMD